MCWIKVCNYISTCGYDSVPELTTKELAFTYIFGEKQTKMTIFWYEFLSFLSNDLSVALFFSLHLPANFTKQQQQNYYELKTDLPFGERVSGHAEWQDHSHSKAKVKHD